jgi:nicotinate-nucleotide adenylyltransferase
LIFRNVTRLGLMGGTFNPVHLGHLRAAEELTERLRLDRLIFMPSAAPPHKPDSNLVGFDERLHMLRLAVQGQDKFVVSDLENSLTKPSYTANTLRVVSGMTDPGCRLFFLVGFDSFRTVAQWRDCSDLFRLASFAVFRRPGLGSGLDSVKEVLTPFLGAEPDVELDPDGWGGSLVWPGFQSVLYYSGCTLEISSTDLRQRLEEGHSVRYLVPDLVREHIVGHRFYRGAT